MKSSIPSTCSWTSSTSKTESRNFDWLQSYCLGRWYN
jgi:hypothetical protein